jgi:hypothetical protein
LAEGDDVAATTTSPDKPTVAEAAKQVPAPASLALAPLHPLTEPRPSHKLASGSAPSAPSAMAWASADDAGVPIQGGISGASAHLALDLGHAATLSLHLRVKDGVADVRIEGAGAEHDLFRRREVATALRQEGLSLGGWEVHAGAAPPSDMPPVRHAALPSAAAPSNAGTPLAQGPAQALRATTAAAEEGVRRAAGSGGATVVTPPASGRRQATGTARANHAGKDESHDDEREARDEREGLHVTA